MRKKIERKPLKELELTATEVPIPEPEPEPEPEVNRGGRPSLYNPQYAITAKHLCAGGATDSILAESFGVSLNTIRNWQAAHPDFREAVREGKFEIFDNMVERTMAQCALGFYVDIEEVKVNKDGDVTRYTVRKYIPPSVTAQIFWMKNRQPGKWKDVWRMDHSGKVETGNLSSEQVLADILAEVQRLGLVPQQVMPALGVAPMKDPKTKH